MDKRILLVAPSHSTWEKVAFALLNRPGIQLEHQETKNLEAMEMRLRDHVYDGVVIAWARSSWVESARRLHRGPISVVSHPHELQGRLPGVGFHYFNEAKVVRLAFDAMQEAGANSWGYFGLEGTVESKGLGRHFQAKIHEGQEFSHWNQAQWMDHPLARKHQSWSHGGTIIAWIASLSKPVGIFCGHRYSVDMVIQAAQVLQLNLSKEVFVVGCGDREQSGAPLLGLGFVDIRAASMTERCVLAMLEALDTKSEPHSSIEDELFFEQNSFEIETPKWSPLCLRALDRIEKDPYLDPIQLALELGVSRQWLDRTLKKERGLTIHRQALMVRLDQAKTWLQQTDLGVETIAYRLRFSSHSHFIKAFHQAFGVNPGQYRKNREIPKA